MKKAIILAVVTVCLVSFSVVFYYKQVNFSNGGEVFVEDKNIAKVEEKEEQKEKNNWFNWNKTKKDKSSNNKENKNENEEEQPEVLEKDLSICNENGKIMVLMYHKFAKESSDGWTRSLSDFKKDLELLYEKNYYPINMSDYIEGKIDVPYGKTPVVLTFDDGTAGQLSFEWVNDELTIK